MTRANFGRRSQDRIRSIFVHPPTPERDDPPPVDHKASPFASVASGSRTPSPQGSPKASPALTAATVPPFRHPSPQSRSSRVLPVPLQVLPEVRSPPRRALAMAQDSVQLTQKRSRRPKLFAFTELSDSSGSSANSSAANSRQTSPERSVLALIISTPGSTSSTSSSKTVTPSVSTPDILPRRHPIRTRSETSLNTVSSASSSLSTASPSSSTIHTHVPQRRREIGLKLDFTGIIPVQASETARAAVVAMPYSSKLIRKKSGEILKPALKYGGPLGPNGTPLTTPEKNADSAAPRARFESKSLPATPCCPKYVHFDAQLERVKLFLHDQKPQVVSRDGSPTVEHNTSEGEEYPFPSTDDERDERKVLQIKLPNFPTSHAPDTDLYIESLFLDDERKALRGIIMCKNMSFQKWVAARFTLDWWQTTSEVTATHKDSVKGGVYDRFSFNIKLDDILSRIEEMTMFLAIRYNTDGREIWDSNAGQNYKVLFEKVAAVQPVTSPKRSKPAIQPGMGKAVGGRTSQWSVTTGNADDRLADLRAKLSCLTADDMGSSPPQVSPGRERNTFGLSPSRRPNNGGSLSGSPHGLFSSVDGQRSDLSSAGPALAARYDFGTALKTTRDIRRTSPKSVKGELPEMQTGLLQYGKVNSGHAATDFYSPRFTPSSLPETGGASHDYIFSPPVDSPTPLPTSAALPVSSLSVQGPALPPQEIEEETPTPTPTPTPTTAPPVRPGLTRAVTSPATLDNTFPRDSPPSLDTPTGSVTDTPSESPQSPAGISLPRWSPTSKSDKITDNFGIASYASFIEQ